MLKIIIAEDNPYMVLVLKEILKEFSEIEFVMNVRSSVALLKKIEDFRPNIIFLDVDMPQMNAIDVLKKFYNRYPNIFVVFSTAYKEYIFEAFKYYAFDYLVKPYKIERIRQTINRIIEINKIRALYENEMNPLRKENKLTRKLMLNSKGITYYINYDDILFITRIGRKTVVYTNNNGVLETYENLREIHRKLDLGFFRSHKGYIINKNMVENISPFGKKTYIVKLRNTNETALITAEKLKELKMILN